MNTMTPEDLMVLDEDDRRRARGSFLAFYMRMTGFMPPRHIRVMSKLFEAMEGDLIDRAMLFAPPRHAKTLTASTLFPAWLIGKYPTTKIMSVVHTQKYAGKLGRNVRNMIRSPLWPFDAVGLADDSQAREQWATEQGGEYNGFGAIGGNQHGNPAEWLFMDDIVKGRKIAMSPHMREEVWETYKTDLLSRLQGRAKQMMTFTRWHMDDPAGRILPEDYDGRTGWYNDRETGEPWFVLSLPAVAEHDDDPLGRKPGEWLWPEAFGESRLGGIRKRGGWQWSALFQQHPSPLEGQMFTDEHIGRFDLSRIDLTRLSVYLSSDYAVTEEGQGDNPDWTVHQVWGVDHEHNIYLLDMWRGRTDSGVWVRQWIRLVKKWKPIRAFEEAGQIIRAVGPLIKAMMLQESAYTDRVQLTSTVDKPTRAQALLGWAAMGKVFLPLAKSVPAAWLPHLEAMELELKQFPTGRKDDTVDAATLFARGLDRIISGQHPARTRSPHGDTMDDLWSRHDEEKDQRRR